MLNDIKSLNFSGDRARVQMAAAIGVAVLFSWFGWLDDLSANYINDALVQASVAFGVARVLNGVISVMQSISLEFSIAVLGGSVSIGEALDPLNDLVEQYSDLMQLSIGSLLIQKILLEVISDTIFKVTLTISAIAVLVCMVRGYASGFSLASRTFLFLLFLRFSLVLVVAFNGLVDRYFLEEQSSDGVAALQSVSGSMEGLQSSNQPADDAGARAEGLRLLDERGNEIKELVKSIEKRIPQARDDLAATERALADVEQQLSTVQRINVFAREKEHAEAIERVASAKKALQALEQQRDEQKKQLEFVAEEREALVSGESDGFMSTFAGSVSKLADPQTFQKMKDALEGGVEIVLELMTVFLLKTLILPLFFLYLLTKAFKYIWGVDLQQAWNRRKSGRQDEEMKGAHA